MPKPCTIAGCQGNAIARGYCKKHHQRVRKHGDAGKSVLDREGASACSAPGCGGKRYCRGRCKRCYEREYHARRRAAAAPPPRCWAEGCADPAAGEHGLCAAHGWVAQEWNLDREEALATCCFVGCGETIDPEMFGWETPCCPQHRMLVTYAMELEEWGVMRDALGYLDSPDWLAAKWVACVLGGTKEGRPYLDRVVGDTPLFEIVTSTLGGLYPDLPFLIPR